MREEDNDIRHKTKKLGEKAKLVTQDLLVSFYYLHKTSFQDSGGVQNKNKVFDLIFWVLVWKINIVNIFSNQKMKDFSNLNFIYFFVYLRMNLKFKRVAESDIRYGGWGW